MDNPEVAEVMNVVERRVTEPCEGVWCEPVGGSAAGVLVLAGSSGRIDAERCRVLARAGLSALSIRWFGGAGQPPGICEVPLETFTSAIDLLRTGAADRTGADRTGANRTGANWTGVDRIGVLGVSKGAEAALLVAVRDPRVRAVVAFSPTSLVWGNVGPGADGAELPRRSSWTWRREPLPFVGYDETWWRTQAADAPLACRGQYERSRALFPDAVRRAAIPLERSAAEAADIVLVAGGDDRMWPSLPFAQELAARRPLTLLTAPAAGHRIQLPGEPPFAPSSLFRYGGNPPADAALGARSWPHILKALTGPTAP